MLEHFDGFGTYTNVAEMAQVYSGGYADVFSTGRRAGSSCIRVGGYQSSTAGTLVLTSKTTRIMGAAFKIDNLASGADIVLFSCCTAAGEQISLRIAQTTGVLYVSRNGTTLWSGSGDPNYTLVVGTYKYVEFKTTIDESAGSWYLRINGSQSTLQSQTGVNTAGQGGTTHDRIQLIYYSMTGPTRIDVADYYVCNSDGTQHNDFLGDCRIDTYLPSADGANLQFTNSSGGVSATLIDEATHNGDTDYIYSSTAGHRTSVAIPDMPFTPTYVHGIKLTAHARKDDSGARDMKLMVRTGGANYDGGLTFPVSTNYARYSELWENNPATSALLTKADIDAIEIGVKVEA
jgi:hypothetical protein